MRESGPSGGHTELHLGSLRDVHVSVQASPFATLLSLFVEALGGPRQGVPAEWLRAIRRSVPAAPSQAVFPMIGPTWVLLPDCITPLGRAGVTMREELDCLAAVTPEELERGLAELFGDCPPGSWHAALRRPRRWLELYVALLRAMWQAYEPIWDRSAPLRRREIERVGAAVVTGAVDVLLSTVSTRTRFADGTLHLPDNLPYQVDLDDRTLVLVPLVSGRSASAFNLDEPHRVWLGYPVPGFDLLGDDVPTANADALALLLGPVRAGILRGLRMPTTMGDLAARLGVGASTLTYHCAQLGAAGLVERRRAGRGVRISRTPRGDAIVDLLS